MLAFLADENFNCDVVRGVRRHHAEVDIVRVQDVGLSGADDPTILAWAAEQNRIILSHDVNTLTKYAYVRTTANLPMPGVLEVNQYMGIGQAIEEIYIFPACSSNGEGEG